MKWYKVVLRILAIFALAGILAAGIKRSAEKEKEYQRYVQLVMDEQYADAESALSMLSDGDRNYKDVDSLMAFCHTGIAYQNDFPEFDLYSNDFTIEFRNLPKEQNEILQDRLSKMYSRYRARIIENYEAEQEALAEKAKNGVPYVGMSVNYIDSTTLGEAAVKLIFSNMDRYIFYNESGRWIFTADCTNGSVASVEDYRFIPREEFYPSNSSTSAPSSSTYNFSGGWPVYDDDSGDEYDEYNAADYSNEEDFYYDHYDDFFDYYDAEAYWQDHNGD